jgi:beta-glucoside PTS system EIICBA component
MLIVAISGAINRALGVPGIGFALPSFLSIPVFTPMGLYLVGVFTSLILAMVLVLVFGYEGKSKIESAKTVKEFGLANVKKETILSPISGEIVPLGQISDPLF